VLVLLICIGFSQSTLALALMDGPSDCSHIAETTLDDIDKENGRDQTRLKEKEDQVKITVETQHCSYHTATAAMEAGRQEAIDEKTAATIAFNALKMFRPPPFRFMALHDEIERQSCGELIHSPYEQHGIKYNEAKTALDFAEGKLLMAESAYAMESERQARNRLTCKCDLMDGIITEVNTLMNADTRTSSAELYKLAKACLSHACELTGDVSACEKNAAYPETAPALDPVPILKYLYKLSLQWNECGAHSQLNGMDVWQESEKFAILGTSDNSTSWVYTENGTSTTTTSIHTSTTTVTTTSTTTLSSSSTISSSTISSSSSTSSLLQADNSTFDKDCKKLGNYSTSHVVSEVQRSQDTLDNMPNGSVCETLFIESVDAAYAEMERRDTLRTVDKKITVAASFNTLYQGSCEEIYKDFETMSSLEHQLTGYEERIVREGSYAEAKIIYKNTYLYQQNLQDECYCATKAAMEQTWIELNDPSPTDLYAKLFVGSDDAPNLVLVKPTLQGNSSRYETCVSSITTDEGSGSSTGSSVGSSTGSSTGSSVGSSTGSSVGSSTSSSIGSSTGGSSTVSSIGSSTGSTTDLVE